MADPPDGVRATSASASSEFSERSKDASCDGFGRSCCHHIRQGGRWEGERKRREWEREMERGREGDRERERGRQRDKERGRESARALACERKRQYESERARA